MFVFAVILGVDVNLLAPWVSWGHDSFDSGDLISSAYFLGIPHPTGYPTYCMLAKLIQTIVPLHNIAWRTNLFSAICAAVAGALIAFALHRALTSINSGNGKNNRWMTLAVAAVSGLALGFSRTLLNQSVVSEVYTLNAAFVSLVVLAVVEVLCSISENRTPAHIRKNLVLLSFCFGLTLTNHVSSAFLLPIILAVFFVARSAIRLKTILHCVLFFAVGLIPYIYLPIRSASNTPYDWGNPQTLAGFIWVVTGRQFKHLMFASFDYQVVHRLFDKFEPILEIGFAFSILALWGATLSARAGLASRVAILGLSIMVVNLVPVMNYHIPDTEGFLLPTYIGVILLAGLGLNNLYYFSVKSHMKYAPLALFVLALGVSSPWYVNNIREANLSHSVRPKEYADSVYNELPDGAILVETYYGRAFTMWYKHFIDAGPAKKDIAVIYAEHLMFDWGIEKLGSLYPWVDFPKADPNESRVVKELVELNAGTHPVYLSREFPALEKEYEFVPEGEIFLLKPVEKSGVNVDSNNED